MNDNLSTSTYTPATRLTIALCELAFSHFDTEATLELTEKEIKFDWDSFFVDKNAHFQQPPSFNLNLFIKFEWNQYIKFCVDHAITPCACYTQKDWIAHWDKFILYHQSFAAKYKISTAWLKSIFLTIALECESFQNNNLHIYETVERTLGATFKEQIEELKRTQNAESLKIQQEFSFDIEKANKSFVAKIAEANKNFQKETRKQLIKSEKKISERINKTADESSKKAIENAITILGIFASVILTFYGALSFSTAVLGSLKETTNAYRLILITLIIGFISSSVLFALLFYLHNLRNSNANNSKERKLQLFKKFKLPLAKTNKTAPNPENVEAENDFDRSKNENNTIFRIYRFSSIAIFIGIFITLIAWFFGAIEARNKRILDKYPPSEETTICETTTTYEETTLSEIEVIPLNE